MSAVPWPRLLEDTTPLPYAVWRVLNLVDGRRDVDELAALARLSPPEVQQRLDEAQRWLSRAAQREQRVTPESAQEVTQCLTSVVGPVASLMVDEVLDDLGPQATMSALLAGLAEQLSPDRLQVFARSLRDRGLA